MKYFSYGRKLVDDVYCGPDGYLPANTTSSVFYNANWFCASEIDSINYDGLEWFDPTEITKEYFDEAFAAQPIPPPSGSI